MPSTAADAAPEAKFEKKPTLRRDDPEPMEPVSRVGEVEYEEFSGLHELFVGRIVSYTLPKTWPTSSRGQVRPAIVVFCYRTASGEPTGTVNLVVFLNGPADTGDMAGPKARCTAYEAGVKRAEGHAGEPGRWHTGPSQEG